MHVFWGKRKIRFITWKKESLTFGATIRRINRSGVAGKGSLLWNKKKHNETDFKQLAHDIMSHKVSTLAKEKWGVS